MVVIAIIGLLASLIIASLNSARVRSRDAKRLGDIDTLKKVLALYELDNNAYPRTVPPGPPWKNSCENPSDWMIDVVANGYISILPLDPMNGDELCYQYRSDGVNFKLAVFMERDENKTLFAVADGGTEDEWYEIFTAGGQNWNVPNN